MNKPKDGARKVPTTPHVLKPHEVALCTIFVLIYRERDPKIFPPSFLLHVQRFLLNECSQVSEPKSWKQIFRELTAAPRSVEADGLIESFKVAHIGLYSGEKLGVYLQSNLPPLYMDKDSEEQSVSIINRRSIFGAFLRRCFLSYTKMSWATLAGLSRDYMLWCKGEEIPLNSMSNIPDDPLSSFKNVFKSSGDTTSWAKPDAYAVWQKAYAIGDEIGAIENSRKYFEQRFHEGSDSGLRQNALLNLLRMHYVRGEYDAARKMLVEAIQVARNAGDKIVLQHCTTMLNRLPPTDPQRKSPLNEIQPDLHPFEILFDVKKLVEIENEQPLCASFEKLVQSIGLYDRWVESHPDPENDAGQWAQHAVQAVVWHAAGCDRLADIEENIVISFTENGSADNNRLTAILNKAYKQARQGLYTQSLAALLEPDVWRGLTMDDYLLWALELWEIMALRVLRRGQNNVYANLCTRRPPGPYSPRYYTLYPNHKLPKLTKIDDALYEVIRMKDCDQITTAVQPLLTALWHSEYLQRLNSYRTGIIMLADLEIEFGLTLRSHKVLEELLPQLITGNDLEQRALACFTLARGLIASSNASVEVLREAVPYLQRAEADFGGLEMHRAVGDVQYMLAVVYHNMGLEEQRDVMSQKHMATLDKRKMLEGAAFDDEFWQVLDIVARVGTKLAGR